MPRKLFTPAWRRQEARLEAAELALLVAVAVLILGVLLVRGPAPGAPPAALAAAPQEDAPQEHAP